MKFSRKESYVFPKKANKDESMRITCKCDSLEMSHREELRISELGERRKREKEGERER